LHANEIDDCRERGYQIGVRKLDALGRPGGSRGVDKRRDIVRPHRSPCRIEIEIGFGSQRFELFEGQAAVDFGVDDDHPSKVRPGRFDSGQEIFLGDYDLILGIAEQVPDLLWRRGVVDRERDRAEVHDGGVRQVELWTVTQHEADRVAALDTKRRQPAGNVPHAIGVLAPRDSHFVADRPDGHLVRL